GYRARELRLDIDDIGIREPTDQIDIVDRQINHHANVRHARRKRPDAGDADGQYVFSPDRFLDRFDGRIETFDVANHQAHAGAACGADNLPPLLDRRRDGLFHHDVDAVSDTGKRDVPMQMSRGRDRDCVDITLNELLDIRDRGAA